MKIKLKNRIETKFFVMPAGKIYDAEKLNDGRYRVHVKGVVSVIVSKKNISLDTH